MRQKNPHAVELGKARMRKFKSPKALSRFQSRIARERWKRWRKLKQK